MDYRCLGDWVFNNEGNIKCGVLKTSIPGNGVTSDPVAKRMFFVEILVWELSSAVTVTSFAPVIVPWPLWLSTFRQVCKCYVMNYYLYIL